MQKESTLEQRDKGRRATGRRERQSESSSSSRTVGGSASQSQGTIIIIAAESSSAAQSLLLALLSHLSPLFLLWLSCRTRKTLHVLLQVTD